MIFYYDMRKKFVIQFRIMFVNDDKDHVETGEDGRLQADVVAGCALSVVSAEDRIRRRQYRRTRVQDGRNALEKIRNFVRIP